MVLKILQVLNTVNAVDCLLQKVSSLFLFFPSSHLGMSLRKTDYSSKE